MPKNYLNLLRDVKAAQKHCENLASLLNKNWVRKAIKIADEQGDTSISDEIDNFYEALDILYNLEDDIAHECRNVLYNESTPDVGVDHVPYRRR